MIRQTNELRHQIERILHWEPSSHWRLRDFVHLSEIILSHTNHELNVDDLQAFWYSSEVPSTSFLDTLTHFIDYENWDDFCRRNQLSEMVPIQSSAFHKPVREIPIRWVIGLIWLSILLSAAVAIC